MSYSQADEERKRQAKSKATKSPKHKVNTRKSLQRKHSSKSATAQQEHPHSVSYANTNADEIFDNAPHIDMGMEYINDFLQKIERIYGDTLEYIFSGNDKLAGISKEFEYNNRIYDSYIQIRQEIQTYLDSGIPADIVAQAIADNVELDYTLAVALQPPSDVINLFDITLAQLEGIWAQINDLIQKRQEEMENEYYGI